MYMLNIFLIGYIHTNTNIGLLTKLFLWFRLVINPFGIRFRPLVSQIPNFVKALGAHFFELEQGTRILRAGRCSKVDCILFYTFRFLNIIFSFRKCRRAGPTTSC
ncbi:hypothetical protein Hanom_Chr14g01331261 [Helianthus anomalus]